MSTAAIQRQYNEVVAPHYDLDPLGVTGRSLDRAVEQLREQHLLDGTEPLRVLDVGMGTGRFLAQLKAHRGAPVQPFGLDLAEQMVATARRRLPDLSAEVADAANLDACFPGQSFDLVATHFVTGFCPLRVVLPHIWSRLREGGYWSLVGGTRAGFPGLQALAQLKALRWLCGAGTRQLDDVLLNPADQDEVVRTLEANGFAVCAAETFEPVLDFPNFGVFLDFAYRGGWFTPIIEALGLHRAAPLKRWLLNRFFFPVQDHHSIAIVLARKVNR